MCLPTQTEAIKIISVNIGQPITKVLDGLAELVKEHKPTFLFVQEACITRKNFKKKMIKNKIQNYTAIALLKSRKTIRKEYINKKLKEMNNTLGEGMSHLINPENAIINGGLIIFYETNLQNKLNFTLDATDCRTICVKLQNKEYTDLIYNIYAPASGETDNNKFFSKLSNKIQHDLTKEQTSGNKPRFIIAGDMNAKGGLNDKKLQTASNSNYLGYKNMLIDLDAEDKWRALHPTGKEYTYTKKPSDPSTSQQTRIDCFITQKTKYQQTTTEIMNFDINVSKDHNPIIFSDNEASVEERETEPESPEGWFPKTRTRIPTASLEKLELSTLLARSCPGLLPLRDKYQMSKNKVDAQIYYKAFTQDIKDNLSKIPQKKPYEEKGNGEYIKHNEVRQLKWFRKLCLKTFSKNDPLKHEHLKRKCSGLLTKYKQEIEKTETSSEARTNVLRLITKRIDYIIRKLDRKHIAKQVEKIQNKQTPKDLFAYIKRRGVDKVELSQIKTKGSDGQEAIWTKPWNIISAFNEFWSKLYNTKLKPEEWPEDKDYPLDELVEPKQWSQTSWIITEEDFKKALKQIGKNKAPGESQIGTEVLAALPNQQLQDLYDFFLFCWENEWIPDEWRHSQVVLIPKSENLQNVADFRPIALQEAAYKVFTTIILEKAMKHAELNSIIDELQFGGKKGVTLAQAHLTFQSVLEDAKQFKKELHVLYIDFSKAFDSVEPWILEKILSYYDYPPKFVNMIREIYTNNTVELFSPLGSNGKRHEITRGIKQGCVLSPLLFNLYMNLNLTALSQSGRGYTFANNNLLTIPGIQFVDDLTLLANSREEMQELVEIVENFCKDTGMILNTKKTQYTSNNPSEDPIHFDRKSIEPDAPQDLKPFPKHESTRLLGIYYNLDLDFEQQENITTNALKQDLGKLRNTCLTVNQTNTIINCMIIPRVSARLNTICMSQETLRRMDKQITNLLCNKTNIPISTTGETFWRRYEDLGFQTNSVQDEQIVSFISTAFNSGLNSKQKFPRECLRQRYVNSPNKLIDIPKIKRKDNTDNISLRGSDFWWDLEGLLGAMNGEGHDVGYSHHTQRQTEIMPLVGNTFLSNNQDYELINRQDGIYVPIYTDGSYNKEARSAGSATIFKRPWNASKANFAGLTSGKQTSINAELFAIEVAISRGPIDENIIIFTDCLSAIKLIHPNRPYKEISKCENRAVTQRINKLINQRETKGFKTILEWVPSHTDDTGANRYMTPKKQERLEHLKDTYGENMNEIILGNKLADYMAKGATFQNETERTYPNPLFPIGLSDTNLTIEGTSFQGDIRRELKRLLKNTHRDSKMPKTVQNTFVTHITGNILKCKDPTLDKIQRFLFQSINNLIRTPKVCFARTVTQNVQNDNLQPIIIYTKEQLTKDTLLNLKEKCKTNNQKVSGNKAILIERLTQGERKKAKTEIKSFYKTRQKLLHNSPFCHLDNCKKGTIANFTHIVNHEYAREKREKLKQDTETMVTQETRKPYTFHQPWNINAQDKIIETVDLEEARTNITPISNEEQSIIDLKLATKKHIKTRKQNEYAWCECDKSLKTTNERNYALLGLMPKSVYKELKTTYKLGKRATDKLATDMILSQTVTLMEIKNDFWKSRFESMKNDVNINALRIWRPRKGDT